jgi:hypothetical protein
MDKQRLSDSELLNIISKFKDIKDSKYDYEWLKEALLAQLILDTRNISFQSLM